MMLSGGSIASGEAYMQGLWTSPDLVAVMRLFSANLTTLELLESKQSLLVRLGLKVSHALKRNTRSGSRKNISAHYDLGNDFFKLFLDPTMMYSAAVFRTDETSLEEASTAKLDELCRQLELDSNDHLLEIGTGWGGMAIHAATHYGCRVTTTTISREQYEYALAQVQAAGLAGPGYRAVRGLPQPAGQLRQTGFHRDDRGGRPRLLQQLLPALQRAAEAARKNGYPGDHYRRPTL